MIHLYGVAEGLEELPAQTGIGGAPLEHLRVDGFDLVFSEVEDEDIRGASEQAVIRHELVVEALMERCTAVLPGQLGRGFGDPDALARAVETEAGALRKALRRVAGCVELGVRILQPPQTAESSPQTGGEYLRSRLEQRQRVERRARELHEALSGLARASTCRLAPNPDTALEAAYLLPAGDIQRFRDALGDGELAPSGLDFVCTGPWPPYSFTSEEPT